MGYPISLPELQISAELSHNIGFNFLANSVHLTQLQTVIWLMYTAKSQQLIISKFTEQYTGIVSSEILKQLQLM